MKKLIVTMLSAVCSHFAFAENVTLANPAVGGIWNDPATWSANALPAAGDSVTITPTGDATLTLTNDVAVDFSSLVFRSANSLSARTSLTFDTGDFSLLLPYSSEGRYASMPFIIADGGTHISNDKTCINEFLEVNDSVISNEYRGKAASVKLDKAKFTLSQTANGAVFRLERGTFNAYDPEGTAYYGRQLRFQNYANGSRFEACKGTVLEWPAIISGWNYPGYFVFDGATVNVHSKACFGNDNRYYYHGTTVVSATNSIFNVDSTLGLFGKLDYLGKITNTFNGCDMSLGGLKVDYGVYTIFNNCKVETKNDATLGVNAGTTEVVFDGGEYFLKAPKLGGSSAACGKLSIRGGAFVQFNKSLGGQTDPHGQHLGFRGTGVVDVVEGTLQTEDKVYVSLYVGKYADAYGTGSGVLNVHEGGRVVQRPGQESWAASATDGIAVGGSGHGVMNVYGGDVRAVKIHVGFEVSCKHSLTQEIHQTGGRVHTDYYAANYSYVGLAAYAGSGGGAFNTKQVPQRAAYYLNGGVLETARLYGGLGSACQGGSGYSKFSADGGVMRQNMSPATYYSIEGLDLAEFGDQGLTFDSNGYNVKIKQDLVNKPGEDGVFVKTGAGELSYTGVCSVASLRVEDGTFKVEAGARIESAVTVGKEAVLSLEGAATSLRLKSLAITNGYIRVDPGDTIYVDGPFSSSGFDILFTSASEKDQVQNVLSISGELDDETLEAIRRAFCNIATGSDTPVQIGVATVDGRTIVTVKCSDPAASIGSEKTSLWKGSGDWSQASNWEPTGVPGSENKAAFSVDGSKSVTVNENVTVGAIAFTAGDHKIEGNGGIDIVAPEGAAEISSAGGTNTLAVPVLFAFNSCVKLPVDEGSILSFDRPVSGLGFKKTGLGTLRLGAPNTFGLTMLHSAGTLSLGNDASLGVRALPALRFTGGVLAVSNASEEAVALQRHVEMDSGNSPVVFDTPTDASIALKPITGPVFKRGEGTLTFELNEAENVFPSGHKSGATYDGESLLCQFDNNGMVAPTTQMTGGVTVAEGRLRIAAGKNVAAKPNIEFSNAPLVVGTRYKDTKADPILELDGVSVMLRHKGNRDLCVGLGLDSNQTPHIKECALVLNDADLKLNKDVWAQPNIGGCAGNGVTPRLSMFNSTFEVYDNENSGIFWGGKNGAKNVRFEAVDSEVKYGGGFYIAGNLSGDVTNTLITSDVGTKKLTYYASYNSSGYPACGYLRLAAGSELCVNKVSWKNYADIPYVKPFRLVFDDATWTVGDSDIALELSDNHSVDPELFSVECQKGGLRLPVLAGRTFSSNCRFFGEGGIVKTGEGTLMFGNGAFAVNGTVRVEEGVLDLTDAGLITNAVFAGTGTIRGASFGRGASIDPGIGEGWESGDLPLFDNCSFPGPFTVKIDPSLSSELQLPLKTAIPVARFTGSAPDVSRWRVANIWEGEQNVSGRFEVRGDTVYMTVECPGLMLIVR